MEDFKDIIFGLRPVIEAIRNGKEINKVLVQQGLHGDLYHELRQALKGQEGLIQTVPIQKLNRVTRKNHQGIIAFISPIEYHTTEMLLPYLFEQGETPLLMILDRVTDVRNFGAIARTAACMGVHGLIVPDKGSALVSADAVKTSAGALMDLPVCKEKLLKQTIFYLQQSGIKIVACTEKADVSITDADLTGPIAVIMGSEEDGISPEYLKRADLAVKIPMSTEGVASLNVSVAAGMVLYEMQRQRMMHGD